MAGGFTRSFLRASKAADGRSGFTLAEVMVTTAVMALAIVFIYEAFFITLGTFNYCYDYLSALPFAEEKMWQAQNSLKRFDTLEGVETDGVFTRNNKDFAWSIAVSGVGDIEGLYRCDLALSWKNGKRSSRLSRSTMVRYEKRE